MTKYNVEILDRVTIGGERKKFDVDSNTKNVISYLIGSRNTNSLYSFVRNLTQKLLKIYTHLL